MLELSHCHSLSIPLLIALGGSMSLLLVTFLWGRGLCCWVCAIKFMDLAYLLLSLPIASLVEL
jgi:hypothetical protein